MKKPTKFSVFIALMISLAFLSACQSVAYYSQSVIGHTKLMMARSPIDKALLSVEPKVANKLLLSKDLKDFASKELALSPKKSYSSYVALKRDYPVWVVVAAKPYSLEAKQWCYLVIGCTSYRGYFSEKAAHRYAAALQKKGWETHVGGASAYSTLGWFDDPLLPSMMRGSDAAFAEVVFHEMAHQRLYLNGNSGLNEAFASFVGQQGTLNWLQQFRPDAISGYKASLKAEREFTVLIERLKGNLLTLYQLSLDDVAKQQQKQRLHAAFAAEYEALKVDQWSGRGYYDRWLLTPINNAKLAAFSTYHDLVPKMATLFNACNSSFERFYEQLEANGGSEGFLDPVNLNEC